MLKIGLSPSAPMGAADGQPLAEQAQSAERLGFDSFWLPESHFFRGAIPSPLLLLAFVAARTRSIRLGTTSLLLPIREPVLLAEDLATLDAISDGRLILGLGRGFRPSLFQVLGIEPKQKRALFDRVLQKLLGAWQGERLDDGTGSGPRLWPSPVQRPHPPLWMAAFGPLALEQAARHGMPYLASPIESVDQLEKNYQALGRLCAELDVEEPTERPIMRTVFVHGDAAILRRAREALEHERRQFLSTAAPVLRDSLERPLEERVLMGEPAEVAEQIDVLSERTRVTHLIARCSVAGLGESENRASVELFAGLRS